MQINTYKEVMQYEKLRYSIEWLLKSSGHPHNQSDIDNIIMLASSNNSNKEHLRNYYLASIVSTVKELYI